MYPSTRVGHMDSEKNVTADNREGSNSLGRYSDADCNIDNGTEYVRLPLDLPVELKFPMILTSNK